MWEHWGCWESVQQDAISKCGYLDHHDIGTCQMPARAKGTVTISTNAIGRCATKTKHFYLCGGAEWCARVLALEEGRCAHDQIIEGGRESDIFVRSNLVEMYAKCGSMEDACRVFNKMLSWIVFTWNAILTGCTMHGHGRAGQLLNILMGCVKKVYSKMMSLLCVFCQLVVMQGW